MFGVCKISVRFMAQEDETYEFSCLSQLRGVPKL